MQHLIPGCKYKQAKDSPNLVPVLFAGTESRSGLPVELIDQLEYLMHEESQDVQHEEGFGKILLAVAEVVLQVIALILQSVEPFILDLPPRTSSVH